MFRPTLYHPYKPSSPAGFRLGDLFPKRGCFNIFPGPTDFTTTRSPDHSPLNSPVRGVRCSDDDNAPPTLRLADLFAADGFPSPQGLPSYHRHAAMPNVAPPNDDLPIPPRRKTKHARKRLSFKKDTHHPRDPSQHRRAQRFQAKRDAFRRRLADNRLERRISAARNAFTRLRREAETLMTPGHMTPEDGIFLKQLGRLDLNQKLSHDLELSRLEVARAAEEADVRRQAHEARDAEARTLWSEQGDKEVLDAQRKKVDAFVRENDVDRQARFRHAEEEAMRADEKRQRAHQAAERMLREEQERRFHAEQARKARQETRRKRKEQERREREEMELREREAREHQLRERERRLREDVERIRRAQKERRAREAEERRLREEVERLRREAHEQRLREEQERLAREERERQSRLDAELARRAAEKEQILHHFVVYEGKWHELRTSTVLPPIDVREMPWPVFGIVSTADQITEQDVRLFLFHPFRPGVQGKTPRDKVKTEVLRFHPDKFNTRIVPKIQQVQRTVAQEMAGAVARILTTIMAEEEQ